MSTWKDRAEKVSDWKSRAQKVPDSLMTPDEFGAKIKAKYPDYAAMDNLELSRCVVAKYPEYASQVALKAPPSLSPERVGMVVPAAAGSMDPEEEEARARYRYLQLKKKKAQATVSIGDPAKPESSESVMGGPWEDFASPDPDGPWNDFAPKDRGELTNWNPDEISNAGAAKQAIVETLSEDVPYLGAVAKAVRSDIPGYIAEKSGQFGIPRIGATVGTAIGTAGELIPQKGWELAALGAAKPLAAAGKYVGAAVAPKLISFLTRIEPPIVGRAIARAGELGKKELLAPAAIEDAIKGLGEGIKAGRSALGQKLAAIEDHLAARYTKTIPASDIGQKLAQKLSRAGFSVEGQPVGKVVRDLHPDISQVLGDFQDLGFKDALNLRRKIDDMVTYDRSKMLGLSDTQTTMLKGARAELNARIKAISPRYEKATAAYAQAAQVYDDLAKDVLSGRPETIQRRIAGMFSKGSADRQIVEKVDRISERAGASLDTIFDSMTAQKFRPVLNPAVERAAFHTGGGIIGASGLSAATAMGHPGYALGAGAAMMATSPRLAGLGIRAFSSPVGQGQIPGLATGAVASLLAANRPPELSPNMQAVLKAANARGQR